MSSLMVKTKKKSPKSILIVAAESTPYASVGGAAQVVSHLSKSLKTLGLNVAVFMPKFGSMDEAKYDIKMLHEGLQIPTGDEQLPYLVCNIKTATNENGVVFYFLENQEYYEKRANVYGYSDDPTRWALLSRGVIEFVKLGHFVPDVIHCNDWHTGLVANYLKTEYKQDENLSNIATVFTIHNLAFQGMFNHKHVSQLDYDDGQSAISNFFDPRLSCQNFMRRGIMYSDAVNTVSKTYSKEILTPEFGEGLDKLLVELRGKIFGIINGIDYEELNPATDTLLAVNYDISSIDKRDANKAVLQREYDLPEDPDVLTIGFVGRLDNMKGVDLIIKTLYYVLRDFNVQFVQVGGGDGGLADMLTGLKNNFPKNVGIHPFPNFTLPHMIFSGVDCVVYPSRFEPCGIVQLESMRYGAVPIVRKVGGLADTVDDFDYKTGKGTGFVFTPFDEFGLYGQIIRAMEIHKNKQIWRKLQKNCMHADFSWEFSASEYSKLYDIARNLKKGQVGRL